MEENRDFMNALGLDIGTTTICGTVVDTADGEVKDTITLPNDSIIQPDKRAIDNEEKIQDPLKIFEAVSFIISKLNTPDNKICAIGLTGQMHGVLYVDSKGLLVSPLYTWQDKRGDLQHKNGKSYAEYLSSISGYALATGFGAVTHYYNCENESIPDGACTFCTIQDYVGMKLTGRKTPLVHTSNAASLGIFDLKEGCFDNRKITKIGMNAEFFPKVSKQCETIGETIDGIPVAIAIGDNQASFIGSVNDPLNTILVNVGTGSQISMQIPEYVSLANNTGVETRPGAGLDYLLVGSPLCGGRALASLEKFFRRTVELAVGEDPGSMYRWMDICADRFDKFENKLNISTKFCGTRNDPDERGVISNIAIDNFTPEHFIIGVLEGIVNELYYMYKSFGGLSESKAILAGSGNGIRKSPAMKEMFEKYFNMEIKIPVHKEEAAYGAALYSMVCGGIYKTVSDAQKIVKYI